jgi:hypothetical protein
MQAYKEGQRVYWKWMGNKIFGVVVEVHLAPIVKEIKGKFIKRNGSVEKPAYFVKSEAGNFALKLCTELESL